jgi:hypothetical protein
MTWLLELAFLFSITNAIYVAISCAGRLRYKDICPTWSTLYVCFLGNSLWSLCNILEAKADIRDVTITSMIALYMYSTRKSWLSSVPQVARRKRVKNA